MGTDFEVTMDEYLPLRDVVFNTLRQAILRGELKPGERLMEIQLANKLGVSRTPIREAIRKLELEGLVLMIPRKGAEVAEITEKNLRDVLEVRCALEELAVQLACDRMDEEGIKAMKEASAEFCNTLDSDDITRIAQADVAFHDIIYAATDNRRLIQLLNNLREQMYRYRIEYLKKNRFGRATFLPLTAIRGDELRERGVEQEFGFVGVASRLVRFDPKYTHIFDSLLGRTVIAEDLDCGIAMARKYHNAFRIVTLDGQVINRGGSMTGGSTSRSAGVLSRAAELVGQAARAQADFAILPEMFVCPFANCNFRPNAEEAGGATVQFLSNLAKYHGLYLVAGSIPELNGGKVYNTSYFFDRNGQVLGKHQKMHLFDAVFQDGSVYRESDAIQAGDHITVVQTEFGPVGLAICFDIRFSELFRLMSLQNVGMIFHPAAFNLSTGPAHWDISVRMRALDQQCFLISCAPARNMDCVYHSYAHSMIAGPWGEVLRRMGTEEGVTVTELDLDTLPAVRRSLPILSGRRTDIYDTICKQERSRLS